MTNSSAGTALPPPPLPDKAATPRIANAPIIHPDFFDLFFTTDTSPV
jgi:hypothetical protein